MKTYVIVAYFVLYTLLFFRNECPPKIIFMAKPSKWPHQALIGM